MSKIIRLITVVFLLSLGLTVVSGCRTAHGFGEDMENAGQSIQRNTR